MDGPKEDSSDRDPRVSPVEETATISERRSGARNRDEKENTLETVDQRRRRKQRHGTSSRILKKAVERHHGNDTSHYQQQQQQRQFVYQQRPVKFKLQYN